LWDLTPCNLGNGRFGGSYFHIITCMWNQHNSASSPDCLAPNGSVISEPEMIKLWPVSRYCHGIGPEGLRKSTKTSL
jgi:hypothetical protein